VNQGKIMINARDEFVKSVGETSRQVMAAKIEHCNRGHYSFVNVLLRDQYSAEEYEEFLSQLDFDYDNGYGRQCLYGTIWLRDGSWMERYEYDGSEEWVWKIRPPLPPELTRLQGDSP